MILKILILFFIILLYVFLIIFLEHIHIHLKFNNYNLEYNGLIEIKYLLFKIKIEFNENIKKIEVSLNIKKFSKVLFIKKLEETKEIKDQIDNEDNKEVKDEFRKNKNNNNNNNNNNNKEMISSLVKSKKDLAKIIKVIISTFYFDLSYWHMLLGLKDNYLTIRVCTILWSLLTPLNSIGFEFILTPRIKELRNDNDININCHTELLNLIKILLIILKSKSLRKLIL